MTKYKQALTNINKKKALRYLLTSNRGACVYMDALFVSLHYTNLRKSSNVGTSEQIQFSSNRRLQQTRRCEAQF